MSEATIACRRSEKSAFIPLNESEGCDDDVYYFNADERDDDAAHAVNQEVAFQGRECADGCVFDAAKCQRDQSDDDQRVEDDSAENCAGIIVEMHDVERLDGGEGHHEHRGDDG